MAKKKKETAKIWGGRFKEKADDIVDLFNASIGFDKRLYAQDIEGSMAHCKMLAKQGILSNDEAIRIIDALVEIKREIDRGEFLDEEGHEDIHSLVEKTLVDKIGPLGEKLHTARSRNDQVALDMKLYVREATDRVVSLIKDLQKVFIEQAEKNRKTILPGYTHLQRAQPVLLSHHLLAYYEMMKRDAGRFSDANRRLNVMPLGSAALAGSTFDLDREMVAKELGFDDITSNSMDGVSDRDFVLEFLFASSVLMMHLSRLSEELILWASQEFGFVNLPDAFCTGSSIMPQKKNPDLPELIRGKTGRVYGNLIALLTTMKGLPLAYNKDMQEDKEGFFDTFDTVENSLLVMTKLLKNASFNEQTMRRAVDTGYLAATDLADYLVRKGMTFRQAHETVGKMVLFAIEKEKELDQFTMKDMKKFSRQIEEDVYDWLDPNHCVEMRNVKGGTGFDAVKQNIRKAKKELGS